MEERLKDVIEELELENSSRINRGFQSTLNQPNLVAVSSANASGVDSSNGFSKFTVNFPRPILEADTLELLSANIPQCNPNIPDTACAFWYYRLSEYSGKVPNTENLFFVRLLPSYYKQEFIANPQLYGFNNTFNTYQDVDTQLELACANDLGYYNLATNPDELAGYDFRYLPGEITIPYNASINKFQMIGTSATLQLAYKLWNSSTTYDENDVVYQDGVTYKSLQSTNLNHDPSSSPLWWVRVNGEIVATFDGGTPYVVGRYVRFNDLLYRCIANVTGTAPPNATYWEQVTETGQTNYRYLITGYNDPNVTALQGDSYRIWNQYALYESGAVVSYDGAFWEANYQNQNEVPSLTSAAWSVSGIPPLIVGLHACSSACDLIESGGVTGFRAPFPEGIPGQPFNPNPRRILNSILGFTWNGLMTPSFLQNIAQDGYINYIPTTRTELYNRLRPVPLYVTPRAVFGLGDEQSTVTQTYTADGYCNLVYSSIISIYASIVAGSTLDTEENTNLLALGSMNCGNLGIAFINNFIGNPLSVNGTDIYNITVQLRDEFGEPYILTNNAVATLVLKVKYKKDHEK